MYYYNDNTGRSLYVCLKIANIIQTNDKQLQMKNNKQTAALP